MKKRIKLTDKEPAIGLKKRIKLTDKELAIGMWVYICLYIESYDVKSGDYKDIVFLKKKWLEAHYILSCKVSPAFYWPHDCWLCNKYHNVGCSYCSLRRCVAGSLYESVTQYYYNKVKRAKALECAKEILGVIQKEVEDN